MSRVISARRARSSHFVIFEGRPDSGLIRILPFFVLIVPSGIFKFFVTLWPVILFRWTSNNIDN